MNGMHEMRVLLIGTCLLINGCSMFRLKGELKTIDRLQEISCTVVCDQLIDTPVVLILYPISDSDLSGYWLTRCGEEKVFARDSGRYYLMAFADANEDGLYQEEEFAGVFDNGKILEPGSGENYQGLQLKLLPPGEVIFPDDVEQKPYEEIEAKFTWREGLTGELTTIDNPLFCDATGSMGLWTPIQFFNEIGIKIYFLEDYDPAKIPVLFVHGAGGHPGTWKPIIESMDRAKYQAWLAFYPSGIRLYRLGEVYAALLDELLVQYKCPQLYVIAHSMGGMVSRSMIQHYAKVEDRAELPVFISIATPWAGHTGARSGVKHAPAVVPSWYDMVPGSPFQQDLNTQRVPPEMKHYLFFAFKGKGGIGFGQTNNDGAVTIESQLSMPIQAQAHQVIGINADHTGILSDDSTLLSLNRILDPVVAEEPVVP